MQRFITRCLIFFAAFFILDKGLIFLRNKLPQRELDKRLEYVITGSLEADIVITGSSRGARDVIASQLGDSLQVKAYNLSYPGSDVEFHEYLINKLILHARKKPKLVIIAIDDPLEFKNDPTLAFRLDRLYPLVKYADIRNTLVDKGNKNKILSDLFVIHQLSIANLDPRKKRFHAQDTLLNDGSMPISWQSQNFSRSFDTRTANYDSTGEISQKIASFKNMIKICTDNHIPILLTFAPNFCNPTIGFIERIRSVANRNCHIMQYDIASPIYRNADYYYDYAHLRMNGAVYFTSEICRYIQQNNLLNNQGSLQRSKYLKI